MTRNLYRSLFEILIGSLLFGGWLVTNTMAQQPGTQGSAQVTAEQQKQLDQLNYLQGALEKDRTALHDAITNYGWDSDQVGAAQNQLTQHRTEYRNLRRALMRAGVALPPPAGFAPGGMGPGRAMRSGRGGRCHHGHHGSPDCADCPRCGM